MLTDNAFFLRLWMFWGSAGAQSASSAVHSADPWPYHICTFRKSSAADRCSAFLTVQQNTGSFCQFQSLFSQPLLDLGRLHVTVLRYILNTYTGVITDVFLYLLELGFHLLTAMRAQKRSCHIVKICPHILQFLIFIVSHTFLIIHQTHRPMSRNTLLTLRALLTVLRSHPGSYLLYKYHPPE